MALPETKNSTLKVENPIMAVRGDDVDFGNGVAKRDVVEHFGSTAIVAVNDKGQIGLITQYRHPMGREMWEIPAGLLDGKGTSEIDTARHELVEEIGYKADDWSVLADVATSPGMTDEACRIFLATDLYEVGKNAQDFEEQGIKVHWVEPEQAKEMVMRGEIANSLAVTGIMTANEVLSGRSKARSIDVPNPYRPHALAERKFGIDPRSEKDKAAISRTIDTTPDKDTFKDSVSMDDLRNVAKGNVEAENSVDAEVAKIRSHYDKAAREKAGKFVDAWHVMGRDFNKAVAVAGLDGAMYSLCDIDEVNGTVAHYGVGYDVEAVEKGIREYVNDQIHAQKAGYLFKDPVVRRADERKAEHLATNLEEDLARVKSFDPIMNSDGTVRDEDPHMPYMMEDAGKQLAMAKQIDPKVHSALRDQLISEGYERGGLDFATKKSLSEDFMEKNSYAPEPEPWPSRSQRSGDKIGEYMGYGS